MNPVLIVVYQYTKLCLYHGIGNCGKSFSANPYYLKCLVKILEVVVLNIEQMNEPLNCPCISCSECQLWQAEAWREDGWKLFFWKCASLITPTREQKQILV